MGFIRKSLFFIISLVLFFLLILGNLFLTLNLSLSYDNVKPELKKIIYNIIEKEIPDINDKIQENKDYLKLYCNGTQKEILINQQEFEVSIPCELSSNTSEEILNYSINKIVEDKYYEDYDCKGFNCFKQNKLPFFLVSKQMKDYCQDKFNLILILIIISILLLLIIAKEKINSIITTGIVISLASIPFSKLNSILLLFNSEYSKFLSPFISQSPRVFTISFTIGVFILIIGILIKIFKWEYYIMKGINKFISLFKRKNFSIKNEE